MSDGSILATAQLSGATVTTASVMPDGYLLYTSESNIGVLNTDTSNFTEDSSLSINYDNGSTVSPRWERILVFETSLNTSLRSTSREIMIGGRLYYSNDAVKDKYLFMYGNYHGNNHSIDINEYISFDQGNVGPTVAYTAMISVYTETGVLALLEDTVNSHYTVCLLKNSYGDASTAQHYEVTLFSFDRSTMADVNWINRYSDDYQAEAVFSDDKIYLMLTLDDELFFEAISSTDGTTLFSKSYDLEAGTYLYLPQMAVSERFGYLYLTYRVESSGGNNDQQLIINLFETSDLSYSSDYFVFTSPGEPTDIKSLQLDDEDQVFIKAYLDSGSTVLDRMSTISLYPVMNTQDFDT